MSISRVASKFSLSISRDAFLGFFTGLRTAGRDQEDGIDNGVSRRTRDAMGISRLFIAKIEADRP